MVKYNQAPLPFQGQKRRWIKQLQQVAKNLKTGAVVIDVFGGSGIVSHTIKQARPDCRVIWNDYDRYRDRLENIDNTNAILEGLRRIIGDYPDGERIVEPLRSKILGMLQDWSKSVPVDWLTISNSICFTMIYAHSYEELEKMTLYNRITKKNYVVNGYLEGVEVVRMDWKEIVEQYRDVEDVVLIMDPPYMLTDVSAYSKETYWGIPECLDVAASCCANNFIYFTSDRSGIEKVLDWVSCHGDINNPFMQADRYVIQVRGKAVNYNDVMYVNI